jgi:hypothetical protein
MDRSATRFRYSVVWKDSSSLRVAARVSMSRTRLSRPRAENSA